METLRDAAIRYAREGYYVFPIVPNTKDRPLVKWGDESTTIRFNILKWWRKHKDANIGIDCGRSGLLVVDVDVDDEGNLPEAWKTYLDAHPGIDNTFTVRTPSGGYHFYYRVTNGESYKNGIKVLDGAFDIRADGGMVVAPPSILENGQYQPVNGKDIAVLPECLVEELSKKSPTATKIVVPPEPESEEWRAKKEEILDLLAQLPDECVSNRTEWFEIGAAIKNELGEAGWPILDKWSRGWKGYNPKKHDAENIRQWNSWTSGRGGYTVRTLQKYVTDARVDEINLGLEDARVEDTELDSFWGEMTVYGELPENAAKVEWDVAGHIPAGRLYFWIGEAGIKKTNLLLDRAVCRAVGVPWLEGISDNFPGFETRPGSTLFINVDMMPADVESRLAALEAVYGKPKDGYGVYVVHRDEIDVANPEHQSKIVQLALELNVVNVVIDCWSNVVGGRNINTPDIAPALEGLKLIRNRLGGANLDVTHHCNRSGYYSGYHALRDRADGTVLIDGYGEDTKIEPDKGRSYNLPPMIVRWITETAEDGHYIKAEMRYISGLAREDINRPQVTQEIMHKILSESGGIIDSLTKVRKALRQEGCAGADKVLDREVKSLAREADTCFTMKRLGKSLEFSLTSV